jgi:hypothetical protein
MLLRAFVSDVLGRMKVEPLRTGLESLLAKRMAPAGAGEAA